MGTAPCRRPRCAANCPPCASLPIGSECRRQSLLCDTCNTLLMCAQVDRLQRQVEDLQSMLLKSFKDRQSSTIVIHGDKKSG